MDDVPEIGLWYVVERLELRFYSANMQRFWDDFIEEGAPIVLLFTPLRPHDDIAMLYWYEIVHKEKPCRISASRSAWKERFRR